MLCKRPRPYTINVMPTSFVEFAPQAINVRADIKPIASTASSYEGAGVDGAITQAKKS